MRVVHLNKSEFGGAAIAAQRIHAGLREQGIDSQFGALHSVADDESSIALTGRWRRMLDPLAQYIEQWPVKMWGKGDTLFSPGLLPSRMDRRINALGADIVHLHWITNAFLPLGALGRISAPVVWTLHDTWAFTGGCHYPGDCRQYTINCAKCPCICSTIGQLFARWSTVEKKNGYSRIKPVVVTPSKNFQYNVGQSIFTKDLKCRHIPNAIDCSVFFPLDKDMARQILGIPQDGHVVAFGAVRAASDPRKGYDLLRDAMSILKRKSSDRINTLVFGASKTIEENAAFETYCLGTLHDDISLRLAYSAADVFVCPSREENLPNTVMESLACGTPVAAFSVGGIPDMVEHGVNGCLATPHDPEELAQEIAFVLEDPERRARMGAEARKVVEERYAAPVIARQYMALYEEVLEQIRKGAR